MASIKEYNSFIDRLRKDNTMAGSNISYEFLKKPIFSFLRARNEQLIAKQNSNPTSPEAKKEVDAFHKTLISFAEESAKNVKSSAESLGFLKDVEATLNAKQPNFDSLISEINRNSNIQQYKKNTQVEILRNLKSYRNTAITLKNTL